MSAARRRGAGTSDSPFPDPRRAPADAPLAVGGDLQPDLLLGAYRQGIFPWPTGDGRIWWWSPDPRAVIPLDGLHVSRTLRRTLRRGELRSRLTTEVAPVIAACADRPGEGTWITSGMMAAYTRLAGLGHVHAVEVVDRTGTLVGGIYGVTIGAAFMGESMFSSVTDASKVAMVHLFACLRHSDFTLFDAQLPTPHLERMGAVAVARERFLDELAEAVALPRELREP